jgi:hypothetical protein
MKQIEITSTWGNVAYIVAWPVLLVAAFAALAWLAGAVPEVHGGGPSFSYPRDISWPGDTTRHHVTPGAPT